MGQRDHLADRVDGPRAFDTWTTDTNLVGR
jgi:hypothetical protein